MAKKKLFLAIILLSLCLACSVNSDEEIIDKEKKIGKNFKEPPNLTIAIGEKTIGAAKGVYSWKYYDEATGEISHTEVDAAPPPQLVDVAQATSVHGDSEVSLLFDDPPSDYTVRVWDSEGVIASYDTIELSAYEGDVIYEVEANWVQGTASYAFAIFID